MSAPDASDWLPGMKVKCLKSVSDKARGRVSDPRMDGQKIGTARNANYPTVGEVYTLRCVNRVSEDQTLILLEEIRNSHLIRFVMALEPGFDAKFFEPVSQSPQEAHKAEQP